MARSKTAVAIALSSALLAPLFLTSALATPAQAAVCDGTPALSVKLGRSTGFYEVDTAYGIPGGKVVLRASGSCAWGLIESYLPHLRSGWIWLERKEPGSSSIDKLGERALGGYKAHMHTGAFTRAGYYVRACGTVLDNKPSKKWKAAEMIDACTAWSLYS